MSDSYSVLEKTPPFPSLHLSSVMSTKDEVQPSPGAHYYAVEPSGMRSFDHASLSSSEEVTPSTHQLFQQLMRMEPGHNEHMERMQQQMTSFSAVFSCSAMGFPRSSSSSRWSVTRSKPLSTGTPRASSVLPFPPVVSHGSRRQSYGVLSSVFTLSTPAVERGAHQVSWFDHGHDDDRDDHDESLEDEKDSKHQSSNGPEKRWRKAVARHWVAELNIKSMLAQSTTTRTAGEQRGRGGVGRGGTEWRGRGSGMSTTPSQQQVVHAEGVGESMGEGGDRQGVEGKTNPQLNAVPRANNPRADGRESRDGQGRGRGNGGPRTPNGPTAEKEKFYQERRCFRCYSKQSGHAQWTCHTPGEPRGQQSTSEPVRGESAESAGPYSFLMIIIILHVVQSHQQQQ